MPSCPGDLPADGHLYIEKSTCTGYTQPNNAGTDCLDTDKTANPGILAEICNGEIDVAENRSPPRKSQESIHA